MRKKIYEHLIVGQIEHNGVIARYGYLGTGKLFIEKTEIVHDIFGEIWFLFTLWLKIKFKGL